MSGIEHGSRAGTEAAEAAREVRSVLAGLGRGGEGRI